MTLKKYFKQYKNDDTPEGDFARDALSDVHFPRAIQPTEKHHERVLNYLEKVGACEQAVYAFEDIWKDYISNF